MLILPGFKKLVLIVDTEDVMFLKNEYNVFNFKNVNIQMLSPDGQTDSVLYIAMAGTHQIWVYFLTDVKWYKGK